VRPGERIPVDGRVDAGSSFVDESAITGESAPADKAPGATVFAGTVNGAGALDVVATRLASESTLARVMRLVAEAETQKAPTQLLVDRFARAFVPAVLVAVGGLAVGAPLLGWLSWSEAFLRATAVLVAASPCALAIATPASVLSAIACAARRGVLVKGGVHLESLGRLRAVAFDKTGTLTLGRPEITDVVAAADSSEAEVLALAAAVERSSTHPLARAIVALAAARGAAAQEAAAAEALPGLGVRGTVAGRSVWAGNAALAERQGADLLGALERARRDLEAAGRTTVVVGRDDRALGVIAGIDPARPGARDAVRALRDLGLAAVAMLSGDQPRVAAAIAPAVGIEDVRAGLLPEDKLAAVRDLMQRHGATAMVGDGVNDAPALATATVGIAMGAAGSDVALETADVALMSDDLSAVPFAVALGRRAGRVIRQNLVVAFGVIAVLLPLAATGTAGIGAAILLHEGSTLAVVANALRLLRPRER
jgi:Cd2+/Zn2+-exporting ATPase